MEQEVQTFVRGYLQSAVPVENVRTCDVMFVVIPPFIAHSINSFFTHNGIIVGGLVGVLGVSILY